MHEPGDVWVPVAADCGHKFDVSLVGRDPETMQFTCPECGAVDGFTAEQAAKILGEYEAAKGAINEAVDKAVGGLNRGGWRIN